MSKLHQFYGYCQFYAGDALGSPTRHRVDPCDLRSLVDSSDHPGMVEASFFDGKVLVTAAAADALERAYADHDPSLMTDEELEDELQDLEVRLTRVRSEVERRRA